MKLFLLLAVTVPFLVNCSPASFNGKANGMSPEVASLEVPGDQIIDNNDDPKNPVDPNNPNNPEEPVDPPNQQGLGVCDPAHIVRIEVRAAAVQLVGVDGKQVSLAPDQEVISLIPNQKSFEIEMSASVRANMLKLKLNSEEQVAVLDNGSRVVLFTPSQTQDGLKFRLSHTENLEKDHSYDVTPHFDFNRSLVAAGNGKCILIPVIHSADLDDAGL